MEGKEIMKCQDELREKLIDLVEEFNERTGLVVESVNVEIIKQSTMYQCKMIVKF